MGGTAVQALRFLLLLVVAQAGCALPSLDYHPYTHVLGGGGYKDAHLTGDQWVVTYRIAGGHDTATVTGFLFRRAKELCHENGYTNFRPNGSVLYGDGEVTLPITCTK